MTRTLLMLVAASMTFACTTIRVMPPAPAVEVSGRWIGTWRAVDMGDAPREGQVDVDLAQDGARGRGRMVWSDTLLTPIPESLRHAGGMGSPVVFTVTGTSMVVRHERSAREFTIRCVVNEDEITGTINGPSPVEVRLTRVWRPTGLTTGERLGRLEADSGRDRERFRDFDTRLTGVATETRGATDLARQALATTGEWATRTGDASSRVEELERLVREAANGSNGNGTDHATNGKVTRAVLHTLDVRFGFDKADLDDAGATGLAEVIDLLKENPDLSAELEGYADAVGSSDYNVRLSQRRVENVHRYLARRGVPLERIHIVGLGPLPDSAPEARVKNRRVTVKLMVGHE
jgi:outer membrane protein OmpA-like peptidoglycan-associated protein